MQINCRKIKKNNLIILESTSPVGTTKLVLDEIRSIRQDLFSSTSDQNYPDFFLAYCPERVLPGNIFYELIHNDRIIGGINNKSSEKAKLFFKSFVKAELFLTNARTAEMSKLTENAFRDINIAFANELSLIAEEKNIDVRELIRLSNRHPRVNILSPGPGVGGHCIKVDPWFLAQSSKNAKLINVARRINDDMPKKSASKIIKKCKSLRKDYKNTFITLFGLAFKANVDDLRDSPSIEILKILSSRGFKNINIVEPNISKLPSNISSLAKLKKDYKNEIHKAELSVILVDHKEFKFIKDLDLLGLNIIDLKGII